MSHSQQIAVMVPFLGIVLWEGLILAIAMWVRPAWYVDHVEPHMRRVFDCIRDLLAWCWAPVVRFKHQRKEPR